MDTSVPDQIAKNAFDAAAAINTMIDDGTDPMLFMESLHDLQSAASHLEDAIKKIQLAAYNHMGGTR